MIEKQVAPGRLERLVDQAGPPALRFITRQCLGFGGKRGPDRAKNVTRLAKPAQAPSPKASTAARTGTDGDWSEM